MKGWQCIINTIYQNSGKLPEFINVLIISGICIMSLPALLLSSFPSEVGRRLVVSPLSGCREEVLLMLEKAGQRPNVQAKGPISCMVNKSSYPLCITLLAQELMQPFERV